MAFLPAGPQPRPAAAVGLTSRLFLCCILGTESFNLSAQKTGVRTAGPTESRPAWEKGLCSRPCPSRF